MNILLLALMIGCSDSSSTEVETESNIVEPAQEEVTELGPIKATVRLSPNEVKLGDPLTLQLEVVAQPNVQVSLPPFGEALGRFQIENFQPRQKVTDDGLSIASQTYQLQAPMSGIQRIPSLRVVFIDSRPDQNPEEQELLTEEMSITIQGLLEEDAPLDFKPARGTLANKIDVPLWVWGIGIGLPLLGGLLLFRKKYSST